MSQTTPKPSPSAATHAPVLDKHRPPTSWNRGRNERQCEATKQSNAKQNKAHQSNQLINKQANTCKRRNHLVHIPAVRLCIYAVASKQAQSRNILPDDSTNLCNLNIGYQKIIFFGHHICCQPTPPPPPTLPSNNWPMQSCRKRNNACGKGVGKQRNFSFWYQARALSRSCAAHPVSRHWGFFFVLVCGALLQGILGDPGHGRP